jgi:hypothetical protein
MHDIRRTVAGGRAGGRAGGPTPTGTIADPGLPVRLPLVRSRYWNYWHNAGRVGTIRLV